MKQILENIKSYLLTKYSQYNEGFANVEKPDGKDVVMKDGVYCGIADNLGNYFYIRSLKDASLEAIGANCRPTFYKRTTKCRIVSIMEDVSDESHELVIIEAISRNGGFVTRSTLDKTKIFNEETGNRKISDSLQNFSLILCEFDVIDKVSAKNCKLELCNC